ncbi:UDP-3-O-acyl-N-acetylglucosamine deacetylase [Gluconobacter oxydans]|uniref:UDP-3-O-acyl-N-acetylglucosamine deacetylase n=2 Tax=Gluconobacter oxydans TaxID=442 RepID=Q5FUI8_GLUOX|nr:UDP-3-O-acyl-N-acetylglucosamine deacetylase [Gluconobacter oxydans]AAW59958.1 UDP-3-O-[3-hydroxymyristoyl] N-acetylglucosamine deacetylase [Gluconobacter oxydans 621H]KXV31186.1 UDP-3-O-(3-hydroxymyristoyl) glucosamine N-acyltransferase [Gluconobacter oxydans]MBF0855144.1 UDP-3-O-acyl-N-acetylglucosamine deacetylase [Gluconobacter oxydans]TCW29330.1 UDP-3-O-[3-hydroxymyristoyl] N-acetylglucosamine deacetylase [Gluconobacter oxydans]GEC60875.1 UDP-3-O-acyl-N-acetylglucosamine deacetylase [G
MQVTPTHGGSTAKGVEAAQPETVSALDGTPSRPERDSSKNLQTTLANPIHCQGIALHSGVTVDLVLSPAPADTGVRFQRSDIEGSPSFPALYDHIVDTRLSTVVGCPTDPSLRVATIEHLMAALNACEIDNILVAVSDPELPVLDGASDAFAFLIRCAGRKTLDKSRQVIEILRNVRVEGENGAFAELRPAQRGLSLAISLSFPAQAIGNQRYAIQLDERRFMEELAFCRTFVNRKDIEYLQSIGLARGGSLETAVVVDGENILNPAGLKIEREFARHKLLDAIGDLYCAGHRMQAGFIGHKSGHALNNRLLRAVFSDAANWRFVPTGSSRAVPKALRARVAA